MSTKSKVYAILKLMGMMNGISVGEAAIICRGLKAAMK